MKTLNRTSLLLAFLLLQTTVLPAQNANTNQAFRVYQDQVKPSMQKEYKKVTKDFITACKQHNLKDPDWSTAQIDGGTYPRPQTWLILIRTP